MRFIWGHEIMHLLSPVDTSSDSLHICLVLVSAALLGVVPQGGFSSHKFYIRLLVRLASAHWVVFYYKVYSNTLYLFLRWILSHVQSVQSLEGYTSSMRVLWLFGVSGVFVERSGVVGEFSLSFPREMDCLSQ